MILASRIDYVWLGEEFQDIIMKAEIKDISILTGSDHKLVWVEIKISQVRRLYFKTKETVNGKLSAKCSKIEIDKEWETISSAILKAAMKHILWITVKKTEAQARFNRQIENINQLYQMQISLIPDFWSQIEIEELKNWGKVLRKKAEVEEHKRRENKISLKIEQRFNMMKKDKKRCFKAC
ncbi:31880_t:CDS:2 [Gigaspora margarita]|uniref:31880_t:CDS:1 n=1 Tax=Gigaspora margarita TaxID=4874 RepID=A0ABN7V7H7_GIGMA|nr:31880_t:CDS:2 [Gigaspora margarita]